MTATRDTLRRLLREVRRHYAPPVEPGTGNKEHARAKCWRDVAAGVAIRLKHRPTNNQTTTAPRRRQH